MKKLLIILCGVFLVFAVSGNVDATTYTFKDFGTSATIHWPSWGNGKDDGQDLITGPDIRYMYVDIEDSNKKLNKVELEFDNAHDWNDNTYTPAGLFISTFTSDLFWDYYVKDGVLYDVSTLGVAMINNSTGYAPISSPYEDYKYSSWTTTDISAFREYHPAELINLTSNMEISVDPDFYSYSDGSDLLTYDFSKITDSGDYIFLDENNWVVAFTERCANDVTWGTNPVPEPATLLLLGSGLLGLAGIGRKRFFKKS